MVLFLNLFVAGLASNNEKTSHDWPNFRQAALHFVPHTADFSHCSHCFQHSERAFGSTAVIVCSVLNVGKQVFGTFKTSVWFAAFLSFRTFRSFV